MHARAGESDRAIKVKMVCRFLAASSITLSSLFTLDLSHSPSISLLESERWARRTGDELFLYHTILSWNIFVYMLPFFLLFISSFHLTRFAAALECLSLSPCIPHSQCHPERSEEATNRNESSKLVRSFPLKVSYHISTSKISTGRGTRSIK